MDQDVVEDTGGSGTSCGHTRQRDGSDPNQIDATKKLEEGLIDGPEGRVMTSISGNNINPRYEFVSSKISYQYNPSGQNVSFSHNK